MPKIKREIDGDELCDYCPIPKEARAYNTPNEYYSCEGCRCKEARENYEEEYCICANCKHFTEVRKAVDNICTVCSKTEDSTSKYDTCDDWEEA